MLHAMLGTVPFSPYLLIVFLFVRLDTCGLVGCSITCAASSFLTPVFCLQASLFSEASMHVTCSPFFNKSVNRDLPTISIQVGQAMLCTH